MSTALGATGDVKVRIRRDEWRQHGSERARFRIRLRTGRRTGTGHDAQDRIAGAGDETIVSGQFRESFDENHAPWRHAQSRRETAEEFERLAMHLAESKRDQGTIGIKPGARQ